VGRDSQEALARHDEDREVEDPLWGQVMEAEPIVVQQPPKYGVRWHPEPKRVEMGESDDLILLRHWPHFGSRWAFGITAFSCTSSNALWSIDDFVHYVVMVLIEASVAQRAQ
jgi:hypothetical protein